MNMPRRVGERYLCFVVALEDRGWSGPYGQYRRPMVWRCVDCDYEIKDYTDTFAGRVKTDPWAMARLAQHHEHGHAPCDQCGKMLLRRKDGTPRQHAHDRCPAKNPGDKIELEYVKNMTAREYR